MKLYIYKTISYHAYRARTVLYICIIIIGRHDKTKQTLRIFSSDQTKGFWHFEDLLVAIAHHFLTSLKKHTTTSKPRNCWSDISNLERMCIIRANNSIYTALKQIVKT